MVTNEDFLEKPVKTFEDYIRETLGLLVKIRPWPDTEGLPFYLRELYNFYETSLLNVPCLLMVGKGEEGPTPAVIGKNMENVRRISGRQCVYVRSAITAYNRKRLIEQRVSFVVPGNQMYLPELGIDLREHFRLARSVQKSLSPATQVIVIHRLMSTTGEKVTATNLSKLLGYTVMTMTRSLGELEAASLAEVHREGRERWLSFTVDKRILWERACPLMRSPVKRRAWVREDMADNAVAVKAGLTALSQYSMLDHLFPATYAIGTEDWNVLEKSGIEKLPFLEKQGCELEIWNYSPGLFARNGVADPFSVYLTLKDNEDERVESALTTMMESVKW